MTEVAFAQATSTGPLRWAAPGDLAKTTLDAAKATGLLMAAPGADTVVSLPADALAVVQRLTRDALTAAGVAAGDRVVVALNNDGDLGGARIAEAAAVVAEAAVAVGPRGRMRLLGVLERIGATVLVATPTGAADLLARLHMEFLVDPLDLELRLLVLTGEITDDKTRRHLAAEFGATVVQLFTEPVTGVPVAGQDGNQLVPVEPAQLALAAFGSDELIDPARAGVRGELVAHHGWHPDLRTVALRTGYVSEYDAAGMLLRPEHTVGDRILLRGQWLSTAAVGAALRKIDGITRWRLEVSRPGTLDAARLAISFNRDSLIRNGMWKARIEQTLRAITPVTIAVEIDQQVLEDSAPPEVIDQRGHHLGLDRGAI